MTGDVCGPFRITWAYWADSGKPTIGGESPESATAYGNCAKDTYCSALAVQGYMSKFQQVRQELFACRITQMSPYLNACWQQNRRDERHSENHKLFTEKFLFGKYLWCCISRSIYDESINLDKTKPKVSIK